LECEEQVYHSYHALILDGAIYVQIVLYSVPKAELVLL